MAGMKCSQAPSGKHTWQVFKDSFTGTQHRRCTKCHYEEKHEEKVVGGSKGWKAV